MPEGSVRNFDEISDRLDQIIATVRSKDTSLERSLDLFDEAIELGSRAVDMVDKFELTPREADKLERADALRTLMAGLVSSGGERLTSPGLKVIPGLPLHVKGRIPYVGRGGLKLEGALDAFGINPTGLACLDVGCSTGGFTDCLLKRGAATVVSVDVGRAQFDWSLRQDDRVTLHERTNVTQLPELGYAGTIDLAVCDVSFTSIANIIDAVLACLAPTGAFCTLVKPQFEAPAGRGRHCDRSRRAPRYTRGGG